MPEYSTPLSRNLHSTLHKQLITTLLLALALPLGTLWGQVQVMGTVVDTRGVSVEGFVFYLQADYQSGAPLADLIPLDTTSYRGASSFRFYVDTLPTDIVGVHPTGAVVYYTLTRRYGNRIVADAMASYYLPAASVVTFADTLRPLSPTRQNIQPTLTEALLRYPGLDVQQATWNTNRISMRGVGNREPYATTKLRTYLDFIPLTDGEGGSVLDDIAPAMAATVLAVPGPSPVAFGSQLGGLVQVQSREVEHRGAYIQGGVGSFGRMEWGIGTGISAGEAGTVDLQYHRTHADGYRDNNAFDRHTFMVNLAPNYTYQQWRAILLHTSLEAEIPSSLRLDDYRNEPESAAFTWAQVRGREDYQRTLLGVEWDYEIDPDLSTVRVSAFGKRFVNDEVRPFNVLDEVSYSTGGRVEWLYKLAPHLKTATGLEAQHQFYRQRTFETVSADERGAVLTDYDQDRGNFFAYLVADYQVLPDLLLKAGLNYHFARYAVADELGVDSLDRSGDFDFGSRWMPAFSATYRARGAKWQLKLISSARRGFALPATDVTLLPDGLLNTELRPETGWSYDLTADYRMARLRWSMEAVATLYYLDIDDLLVTRRTALDQQIGLNAGATAHAGLESRLRFTYDLTEGSQNLQSVTEVVYTYADHRFVDFIEDDEDFSGNDLTGTAPHQVRAVTSLSYRGYRLDAVYRYTDARPLDDANTTYSESYHLFDVYASKSWQFYAGSSWRIRLRAGIQNLADRNYMAAIVPNAVGFGGNAPRYYYPGAARNWLVEVRVERSLEDLYRRF